MDHELKSALDGLVGTANESMNALTERMDRIETKQGRPGAAGVGGMRGDLLAEHKALATFARSGDDTRLKGFQNSMSVGDDTGGGYLTLPAFSTEIQTKLFNVSPIRSLCRVVVMGSGDAFVEPTDMSDADANWVGEQETRSETSAGNIGLNSIPLDEASALVRCTSRLLDDSQFDISKWLTDKLVARFARLEGASFALGNGVKQPKGFLSYDSATGGDSSRAAKTFQYFPSGAATSITADSLMDMYWGLRAPYRGAPGVSWVMSSACGNAIDTLKNGEGEYLFRASLASGVPPTLLGLPINFDENMGAPTVSGAYPIALACWPRAYIIIERPGVKFLRDPYSAKPYTLFYMLRRVGAQSSGDFDSLKLMKVGTA